MKFAGIETLDQLIKTADERQQLLIRKIYQELSIAIAEIKAAFSDISKEILHNLDLLYTYASEEKMTPEFENAITSALDNLEFLKEEAPTSTHEKINKLKSLLEYLKGTSSEKILTPEI